MTEDEFLSKVNWEGGVLAALEYGLRAADLEDEESRLYEVWLELEQIWDGRMSNLVDEIDAMADEHAV